MKTILLREHFKEGLQIVERVVGKTPALPILQNILFSLEKNKVRLAATDLQMGVTCEFVANTKEEGRTAFAPRFVTPLLSVIQTPQISLEGDDGYMQLNAGDFHASIQTANPEDFPIIPSLPAETPFVEVQTSVLCRGLNQVVSMAGQSQARPEIGGVLFVFEKELLKLVATDSFRLAEKKVFFEIPNTIEQSFILPQKTTRELIGILGDRPGKVSIYISPSQAVFDYLAPEESFRAHIQIVSRLIEGEYPDYQEVIPKTHKTKAALQKEDLFGHMKAASIFSGKTNEVLLAIDPVKKSVSFTAESAEAGKNSSFLRAEVTGEKVSAAFNWRFFLEGLAQLKAPTVELSLNGEDGPALLRGGAQEGYSYVIMPIKA